MPPLPKSSYLVVVLGFLAVVFEGYDLIVYGSAVPALLAHPGWHLTPTTAGAIGSYALLGMLLGAPAAGWLSDRFGRRRLFIGLLTWFSTMMVLVAVAPSPELLGLFRFLAGLGFGGIPPTAVALVVEFAPVGRKLLLSALMLCGFGVGGVLAALLSLALLDDIGFRGLFAVGVLPLVTLVPLAAKWLPESPSYQRLETTPARTVLKGRTGVATALFGVANFAGFLLVFGLNTWLPQLMRAAGYDLGSALGFLLVLNLGAIVGGMTGAALSERIGARTVAATLYGLAAVTLTLLTLPQNPLLTTVLVFVAGATAVGSQAVLWGYVATYYNTASRATALGLTSGVGRLGAATGPFVGGLLITAGVGLGGNVILFAAVALVGAVAAAVVPAVKLKAPEATQVPTAT